jgi:cytochrome c oxidase cbb3-type subunit III
VSTAKLITATVALLLLAGCEREQRRFVELPPAADHRMSSETDLYAGAPLDGGDPGVAPSGPEIGFPYVRNAYAISQGKRLFDWFNCSGCHANGGGGIGPPLMDEEWRYGHTPEAIYATIVQGRPHGMPSYRGKIPEQQVWQLVAYVRAVAGLVPLDARPSRSDSMAVKRVEILHASPPPVPEVKP